MLPRMPLKNATEQCMCNLPFPRLAKLPEGYIQRDVVVLVHGMFATSKSMRPAARHLAQLGYEPVLWSYPTFGRSIIRNAQELLDYLTDLHSDPNVVRVNFLTHSLGGIMVRCAIASGQLIKTQRLVMLAPPNTGSHLTRLSLGPFKKLLPAIGELSEAPHSIPNSTRDLKGVEVGVIAAASDLIVRVKNTMLTEQKAHRIIDSTHLRIPSTQAALDLAGAFLGTGRFPEATDASYVAGPDVYKPQSASRYAA